MRDFTTLALVVPIVSLSMVACSGNRGGGLPGDDLGEGNSANDAGAPSGGDDSGSPGTLGSGAGASSGSSGSGVFAFGDAGGPQATNCKGGHYSGSFTGNYTSSLTDFLGLGGHPLMVMGDLEMDLEQKVTMTNGEVPTVTFSIANGSISGLANGFVPYHCELVGSLDCNAKKLVDGAIQCTYCVTPIGPADSGICGYSGHFAGPFGSDYDGDAFSFVSGTWNGSESLTLGDAGLSIPDGGGINDAGLYVGPGHFGGSGTWSANYVADN